jgi:hypothetical protein
VLRAQGTGQRAKGRKEEKGKREEKGNRRQVPDLRPDF